MEISIGADVHGTDGKIGELTRVIVDARSRKVTDLVVKQGGLLGHERTIPLTHVARVADDGVHLDLTEKAAETMDGFAEGRRGPNPDYVGPPSHDLHGTYQGNMALDQAVAAGSAAGLGAAGKPMGYPGGEQLDGDFDQRPAVSKGTDVLASDGEKVGDLGEFCFDHDTGAATRIAIRKGLIMKHDVDVPLEWMGDIGARGILLTAPKGQVEAHIDAAEHTS